MASENCNLPLLAITLEILKKLRGLETPPPPVCNVTLPIAVHFGAVGGRVLVGGHSRLLGILIDINNNRNALGVFQSFQTMF